ncbi:MAG TPA: hypothetical protein VM680_00715 [Verrucomicrobiae bacterium]|nr:hypothetical protein [Verrucomicrobiae bacterium]
MSRALLISTLLLSVFTFSHARAQVTLTTGEPQTSSGGVYSIQGVVGPPKEIALAGGAYAVDRGFVNTILTVETAGAPTMKIQIQGVDLVITWSGVVGAFQLEQTAALGSAWTTVSTAQQTANGDIKITLPIGPQNQFLRLKSATP